MSTINTARTIILSHILTTVPAEDLELYFKQKQTDQLLFIGHPLFFKADRPGSHFREYKSGELVNEKTYRPRWLPSLFQYLADTIITWLWILGTRQKWDLIISLDNLNTFAALILRKLGVVDKVIYYTIDFTPQRFGNYRLNEWYHALDKWCVAQADATWNVSPRVAEGRQEIRGFSPALTKKQVTVPIGIWLDRITTQESLKRQPKTIVYAGGLVQHQGVQNVIHALPLILKKIPDLKFEVIGMGEYEAHLKELVRFLKLKDSMIFKGYFENHEEVEQELLKASLGMALYSREFDRWSRYADPSKMKTYLACGLPIITTDVTHMAPILEKRKCGVVIDADAAPEVVAEAVVNLINKPATLKNMRKNAQTLAQDFDWVTVFDQALKQSAKL